MALRDLGADFNHYRVIEFDRFAVASYNAIHGTKFKTTDIRNVNSTDLGICDTDKFCYIMTYSFPCQDLSVAGRQKGMTKGSGTRSGLLWEVERLLNECAELPQVLLMENVPQVHSKANMFDFQKWIDFLTSKGYSNYWQDLNAKDYGVAQNRNRCFMVSLLGEWNYKFPQPMPLKKIMKDYLEDEVDEKFYINTKKAQMLIQQLIENGTLKEGVLYPNFSNKEPIDLTINNPNKKTVSNCITAKDYSISNQKFSGNGVVEIEEKPLGNIYRFDGGNYAGNVYDDEMLSPTIRTYQGGNQQPMIVAMRGRNPDNPSDRTAGSPTEQRLELNSQGICNCLTSVQKDNMVLEETILQIPRGYNNGGCYKVCPPITSYSFHENNLLNVQYHIRKLTPKEVWRLMGFSNEDFHKAKVINSNSQLYKQAGNSIVKNVLMAIFGQMIPNQK